jgi:glyoxylase-like metal-dependent hydrolase (beta-lactamase superfamily II)
MDTSHTKKHHGVFQVAEGVWGLTDIMVNVYFVRTAHKKWVLVDAGLKTAYNKICHAAESLFGKDAPPEAIILTHGHFDHVGALRHLLAKWHVPVFAHYMEKPYLTGQSHYPPPDPSVGGGFMSLISFLFPSSPINITNNLRTISEGAIPMMPGWRCIFTPGHSPGHISLFREEDAVLVAGDAFVTTQQESLWSIITQKHILSGPPKYFTYDWRAAGESVKKLAALQPQILATGHGQPMSGDHAEEALVILATHFNELVRPAHGRYATYPAVVSPQGVLYVPGKDDDGNIVGAHRK